MSHDILLGLLLFSCVFQKETQIEIYSSVLEFLARFDNDYIA